MTEEIKKDENPISEKESKLAKDVMKIIATSDLRLGTRDIPNEHITHKEIVKRVLTLYLKEDLHKADIELIRQLMIQAVNIVNNALTATVEFSENMALEKLWGKHPDEVTLNDISNMMEVPERLKKKDK